MGRQLYRVLVFLDPRSIISLHRRRESQAPGRFCLDRDLITPRLVQNENKAKESWNVESAPLFLEDNKKCIHVATLVIPIYCVLVLRSLQCNDVLLVRSSMFTNNEISIGCSDTVEHK